MDFSDIAAAIDGIPSKKEDLRKAFVALQSLSSSIPAFTLRWKDLDDHFTSIEKSIRNRFSEFKAEEKPSPLKNSPAALPKIEVEENEEVEPRPELKSLSVKMDGKGLRSYISLHRKDIQAIHRELYPALRAAPDPAALVLDSLEGFFSSESWRESEVMSIKRSCVRLLECLMEVDPEILPSVRDRARLVAVQWKRRIDDGEFGDFVVSAFLHLLAVFGLVGSFNIDEIMDLLVLCSWMRQAVILSRRLGLKDKMPVFVNKLKSNGKRLDAVKFVIEFNLLDEHPPALILEEHVKESKKAAKNVLEKGNYSLQSRNEANDKEMAAIKAVIKTVEEFKLDSVYPLEKLHKHILRMGRIKPEKKYIALGADANLNSKGQTQHYHQPKKRFRPSAPEAPSSVPLTHQQPQLGLVDPIPPYIGLPGYGLTATPSSASVTHQQPQLGLVDPIPPYIGFTGYGLTAAPAHHHHGVASLSGNPVGFGGPHSQQQSYLYF